MTVTRVMQDLSPTPIVPLDAGGEPVASNATLDVGAAHVPTTVSQLHNLLSRQGNYFVPNNAARVLEAPTDGSCLFH